jgi:hypothetical protein
MHALCTVCTDDTISYVCTYCACCVYHKKSLSTVSISKPSYVWMLLVLF